MEFKSLSKTLSLILLLFMFSCSRDDNCDLILCQNGGECNEGICECPTGFFSSNCSQQIVPNYIRITKISLTRFSSTDENGEAWDIGSGPDIYVAMVYDNDIIYEHPSPIQNASPLQTHEFFPSSELRIENPNDRYSFLLFDFDGPDPNTFMAGVEFSPYASTNKFPKTITIDAGGDLAFEISVEYVF